MVLTLTSAQVAANAKIVRLKDLQEDHSLLDDYPHRHVAITHKSRWRARATAPLFFSVIERLEDKGWEVTAWRISRRSVVVMRRRDFRDERAACSENAAPKDY